MAALICDSAGPCVTLRLENVKIPSDNRDGKLDD